MAEEVLESRGVGEEPIAMMLRGLNLNEATLGPAALTPTSQAQRMSPEVSSWSQPQACSN